MVESSTDTTFTLIFYTAGNTKFQVDGNKNSYVPALLIHIHELPLDFIIMDPPSGIISQDKLLL